MDRKTFIKKMTGALLIGIPVYSMLGCSSSDDSSNQPPPNNNAKDCLANGTQSSIGANHGHTLQVSSSDVQTGTEKQYSIQGGSGHNHTIIVTAANFSTLRNNQQIQITSTSGGGHTHAVTISCA